MVAHRRPRACLALARKRTGIRASAAYDQAAYELRARNVQRNTWLCSSMNRRIQSANPLRSRRRRGGLPHCARCRSQRAFRGPPGSRARTRRNPGRGLQSAVPLSQLGGPVETHSTWSSHPSSAPGGATGTLAHRSPGASFAAGAPAGMMSSCGFRVRVGPGSNRRARVQGLGVFGGTGRG
jgi:hypothetical protein